MHKTSVSTNSSRKVIFPIPPAQLSTAHFEPNIPFQICQSFFTVSMGTL
jgi:hypothetical protein